MRTVEWGDRALRDFLAIGRYWWQHNPDRAETIAKMVQAAADFLTEMPAAGPEIIDTAARKWSVRGTDYLLIYRVHADRIEILRVHHARENWRDEP